MIMEEKESKEINIRHRKNIHLVTEENDIKFRQPFSYRHLRIFGWIFLVVAQVGIILGLAGGGGLINTNDTLIAILQSANSLMTPLFIFAAYAQVLTVKDGYRRLLITYALCALGIFAAFVFAFLHYGVGLLNVLSDDWNSSYNAASMFFSFLNSNGAMTFNVFVDLILCTLVMFFINYQPVRRFQGRKIYIFRSLVIVPILLEVASIVIKILGSSRIIIVSPIVIPLLTTKPPVAFLIFIASALFIKVREKYYLKKGKTSEEYRKFLNTNVNRMHFSRFLCFSIVAAVVIDVILFFTISVIHLSLVSDGTITDEMVEKAVSLAYAAGFGKCIPMLLIIPILAFFDYTKTYKDKLTDILIPLIGVGLLAMVYFEGLFEILKAYLAKLTSNDSNEDSTSQAINAIKRLIGK